jgi:hypothetical protein
MSAFARFVVPGMLIAVVAASPAAAFRSGQGELPGVDVRDGAILPAFSPGEKDAQAALKDDIGQSTALGRLDVNRGVVAVTGTGRALTDASGADPERIASVYLRRNAAVFGLDPAGIDALRRTRRYTDIAGVTHIVWTQSAGGIDAYDNKVGANVARDGSLINVWSTALPSFQGDGQPSLSAGQALGAAARDVDAPGAPPRAGAPAGASPDSVRYAGRGEARVACLAPGRQAEHL